jgi:hypothetical protein
LLGNAYRIQALSKKYGVSSSLARVDDEGMFTRHESRGASVQNLVTSPHLPKLSGGGGFS